MRAIGFIAIFPAVEIADLLWEVLSKAFDEFLNVVFPERWWLR